MDTTNKDHGVSEEEIELRGYVTTLTQELDSLKKTQSSSKQKQETEQLRKMLARDKRDIEKRLKQLEQQRNPKMLEAQKAKQSTTRKEPQRISDAAIKERLMELVKIKKENTMRPVLKPRFLKTNGKTKRETTALREREIINGARQMKKKQYQQKGLAKNPFNASVKHGRRP